MDQKKRRIRIAFMTYDACFGLLLLARCVLEAWEIAEISIWWVPVLALAGPLATYIICPFIGKSDKKKNSVSE